MILNCKWIILEQNQLISTNCVQFIAADLDKTVIA